MDKTSFKDNIRKYYNQEAELRDCKIVKPIWKIRVRKKFYNILKRENKKTLLELGAGVGYDSVFFMKKGLYVTAVDISNEMVSKCREKGIEAYELDFYDLSALNTKFDCVYAINSLLHVPKEDLNKVLHEIALSLNENGLFYLGLYGGNNTETELVKSDISDTPRFFAFHSDEYLKNVSKNQFNIISFETLDLGKYIFHSIILRKK